MKVNLNQKFRTPFGEILTNEKTIGETVGKALFYASGLNPEDAYKAWSLSVRIASSPSEVEIDEKDIELIQKSCAKLQAGAYGQILDMLKQDKE